MRCSDAWRSLLPLLYLAPTVSQICSSDPFQYGHSEKKNSNFKKNATEPPARSAVDLDGVPTPWKLRRQPWASSPREPGKRTWQQHRDIGRLPLNIQSMEALEVSLTSDHKRRLKCLDVPACVIKGWPWAFLPRAIFKLNGPPAAHHFPTVACRKGHLIAGTG